MSAVSNIYNSECAVLLITRLRLASLWQTSYYRPPNNMSNIKSEFVSHAIRPELYLYTLCYAVMLYS